jgi:hypothetical protein
MMAYEHTDNGRTYYTCGDTTWQVTPHGLVRAPVEVEPPPPPLWRRVLDWLRGLL